MTTKNQLFPSTATDPQSLSSNRESLPALLNAIEHPDFRPVPGKCVIRFDRTPSMIGSIIVPDTVNSMSFNIDNQLSSWTGTVLHMTPGKKGEDFRVGDRVVFRLLLSDLERPVILTDNNRVDAVVTV